MAGAGQPRRQRPDADKAAEGEGEQQQWQPGIVGSRQQAADPIDIKEDERGEKELRREPAGKKVPDAGARITHGAPSTCLTLGSSSQPAFNSTECS
ncbi:MAG TPA: hypothetical protein VIN06_17675 [Devosia sp.]